MSDEHHSDCLCDDCMDAAVGVWGMWDPRDDEERSGK